MSPINPWPIILVQYGLEFVIELKGILEKETEPTAEDFKQLAVKYGTETLEQKLAKLQAQSLIKG